jgi:formylmethanofuran dehydrogenase subunit D
VWDAWVEISTEIATKLGIVGGYVVKLTSPHGAIEVPAYVSPSLHPGAVAVPIGHRYAPYQVPKYVKAPGAPLNPVALLSGAPDAASGSPSFLGVRVTLAKTGARRPLAIVQATHDQDHRELARHVDLATAREQALRGKGDKPHEMVSMYPPQQ